ncbi:MAG: hypothetical protein LBQ40_05745 [Clostridiales bacterium]|jgi:glutathione synthase/RimK-type ligase-like ATP-grasp enzyme|nr:hypothetical protein [Clostridiales bacterium]
MKNALIVYNGFLNAAGPPAHAESFVAAAKKSGISMKAVKNDSLARALFMYAPARQYHDPLPLCPSSCDFIIFWDKDVILCRILQDMGFKVFNAARPIEICDDKALTAVELRGKADMPETAVAPATFDNIGYTSLGFADIAAESLGFPLVVKERKGSLGQQVYIVRDRESLLNTVIAHDRAPLLFQKFIDTSNSMRFFEDGLRAAAEASPPVFDDKKTVSCDLRIYVIGKKTASAVVRRSVSDFRANIAQGSTPMAYIPTEEESLLAETAAVALGLDFCGVDIVADASGKRYLLEVNSNAGFLGFYRTHGVNIAEMILQYIIGKTRR